MKSLAILFVLVSLPACGQTSHNYYMEGNYFDQGHTPPTPKDMQETWPFSQFGLSLGGDRKPTETDPGPCHPKVDKKPKPDYQTYYLYNCDLQLHRWILDPEASAINSMEEMLADLAILSEATYKHELARSLTTRVLTKVEYGDVLKYGPDIYSGENLLNGSQCQGLCGNDDPRLENMQREFLLRKRFDDELLIQFKLRAIAAEHAKPDHNCFASNSPEDRACQGVPSTGDTKALPSEDRMRLVCGNGSLTCLSSPSSRGPAITSLGPALKHGPWKCSLGAIDGKRHCARWADAGDGCNTCTEDDRGLVGACTALACATLTPGAGIDPECQPKAGETIECREVP